MNESAIVQPEKNIKEVENVQEKVDFNNQTKTHAPNKSQIRWNPSKDREGIVNCVLLERNWDQKIDLVYHDYFESISFGNVIFSGMLWLIVILKLFDQIEYVSWPEIILFYVFYLCEVFNSQLFGQLKNSLNNSSQLADFLIPLLEFKPEISIELKNKNDENNNDHESNVVAAFQKSLPLPENNQQPDKIAISLNKLPEIQVETSQERNQPDIEAESSRQIRFERSMNDKMNLEIRENDAEFEEKKDHSLQELDATTVFFPVCTRNLILSLRSILQDYSLFRLKVSTVCHVDQSSKWIEIRKKCFEEIASNPSLILQEICLNRQFSRISCLYMSKSLRNVIILVYLLCSLAGLTLVFRFSLNLLLFSIKLPLDKCVI